MTEQFTAPASYEEACKMLGRVVVMPNGEVAKIGGAGMSGGFSVHFSDPNKPGLVWVAFWNSERGFETEAGRKARVWDEQAGKLNKTARALVEAVFPGVFERADRASLKEPARLPAVAKAKLHKLGKLDYVPCNRCGGSGRYSYNQIDGDRCFGCAGKGVTLPTDTTALKIARAMKCEAA